MAIRARLTAPREVREDWPWHEAETLSLPLSAMITGDRRMEAENFLSPGFAVRHGITAKHSGWTHLSEIAKVWQPSRLKGIQVSSDYGTPFLAATQVFDKLPVLFPVSANGTDLRLLIKECWGFVVVTKERR